MKTTYLSLIISVLLLISCSSKNSTTDQISLSKSTIELMEIVDSHPEMKFLLEKSIAKAKDINPDKTTNPAQSLQEYYDFVDWTTKALPWKVVETKNVPQYQVAENIYQGLCYVSFIMSQPLEELDGKGLYHNSIQYAEPFRSWIVTFNKQWGQFLDTPESWSDEYYQLALADSRFGLDKDWYENPKNWNSFNDFFSRYLRSPEVRPIASPNDDSIVVSFADSEPQGVWDIDENSNIVQEGGVALKSSIFNSVNALLGDHTQYKDSFAGGKFIHSFLNVDDYHRYHIAVSGVIKEMNIITQDESVGGIIIWDNTRERYMVDCGKPGWQTIETRGCMIVETEKYGLVAMLPIGMSQVSSVNFEPYLKVGDRVKKGDLLGYFLFGGSDFVMLFQNRANFELQAPIAESGYKHILVGELLGQFKPM